MDREGPQAPMAADFGRISSSRWWTLLVTQSDIVILILLLPEEELCECAGWAVTWWGELRASILEYHFVSAYALVQ